MTDDDYGGGVRVKILLWVLFVIVVSIFVLAMVIVSVGHAKKYNSFYYSHILETEGL